MFNDDYWEKEDGGMDWWKIGILICVCMCCVVPQCSDSGGGSSGPSEAEWQRMSDEDKAKIIERELRRGN